MPTHIVVEGAIDRAVIGSLGIVDEKNLLPRGSSHQGSDEAMKTAADLCLTLGEKVIVLVLDLDDSSVEKRTAELQRAAQSAWGGPGKGDGRYLANANGRIRLVCAGTPDAELVKRHGFKRFAIDDYLMAFVHDAASFSAFLAGENHLPAIGKTHAELLRTIDEVLQVLAKERVPVDRSKRYLDVARAVIGFPAARATFAQHLVARAPAGARDTILGPLKAAIEAD